jgi:hypothetical protein
MAKSPSTLVDPYLIPSLENVSFTSIIGGSVTINGGEVDHLIALGTVEIAGNTYYAYGLHG